jgi:putative ATP-dependent endonuclease of OLD family
MPSGAPAPKGVAPRPRPPIGIAIHASSRPEVFALPWVALQTYERTNRGSPLSRARIANSGTKWFAPAIPAPAEQTAGVRISRLRLVNYRGWQSLDLRPRGHVLLAGVPRAGRSDIIVALTRCLDPASTRAQPLFTDIHQRVSLAPTEATPAEQGEPLAAGTKRDGPDPSEEEAAKAEEALEGGSGATFAEVVVTLVDLEPEVEQLCDGYLEPLDADGQIDEGPEADPDAPLGVRLAYRVSYDEVADTVTSVVYFPARSTPEAEQFTRVPAMVRKALPVIVLEGGRPLQLRSEGTLRRLVADRDPDAAAAALRQVAEAVTAATDALSADPVIAETISAVLSAGGIGRRLGDKEVTADQVKFRTEDGTLSALLRTVQPALELDAGGLLALRNHGSTAAAVLGAAESLVLASALPSPIVLADDFGEGLDAATAEHLAAVLRNRAGQLWLTTRRPETARAFWPEEVVRLSRYGGIRTHHALTPVTDRKQIAVRRLLHTQLLPALTAPTVALAEGPHDLAGYLAVDRRRDPEKLPLSAYGIRLVSADNGSGGGTTQIPRVAKLARELGFRVIGVIDNDPDSDPIAILAACDAVVQLPKGMAIERAIVAGVPVKKLRAAAAAFLAYGVPDPTDGKEDEEVAEALVKPLHSHGLHEQFVEALASDNQIPPVVSATLDAIADAASADNPVIVTIAPPDPPDEDEEDAPADGTRPA